jgi:hypothetical protein
LIAGCCQIDDSWFSRNCVIPVCETRNRDARMTKLVTVAIALAAALFIAVSATMNALFLSSLGRTPVEVGLLATISIGADVVKAVLPVVIAWAASKRAWLHTGMASMMLAVVVALSLASGTGFAAMTRGASTAAREAAADELAARRRDVADIETRLAALPQTSPVKVIEAELAASQSNWRWPATKSCTTVNTTAAQKFCAGMFKLRADLASASERDRLTAERRGTRARIEALQTAGAHTDADPQSTALAALFNVDKSTPRLVLTTGLAVMLELGSVVLVLLFAGPALLDKRSEPPPPKLAPKPVLPKPVLNPVELPPSPGRAHWQRQRNKSILNANRDEGHAR